MDEHENRPAADNPLKKAAMATIGAVTGAVEKVADAIGDLASKENIDKMAKKGEEVFDQVKEFSTQTYEKVKTSINENLSAEPLDLDAARDGLRQVVDSFQKTASQAREALENSVNEDNFDDWANRLSQSMKEERHKFDKLVARVRAASKPAQPESDIHYENDDVFDTRPRDGEIPYEATEAPQEVSERMERRPADVDIASPTSPVDEDNTNKLQSEVMNEHIPQQVPPEY